MKNEIKMKHITEIKNEELIFCSFSPVGLDDYVSYFVKNFKNFIYLKWKFPHSKGESELITYKDGECILKKKLFSLPVFKNKKTYFLFLPLNYLIYLIQAFSLKRKEKSVIRIFFGINYFCTLCGIILKKFKIVDYVIYRVMDFFPIPSKGPYRFLNRIFHLIDKFCLNNADSIWFTTEGHILGREKYGYFDRNKFNYNMIPLAVNLKKFISKPITNDNRHSLVYCGVISKYHLLDMLFEVIADLKKDFSDIKLDMIGSGPDADYFKDLSVKMGLENNIIFHGFMEDDEKFRNLMADNVLGIAFYRDEEDFMKYTEPAKVKYYLNFGVPAVVSDVPKIAGELDDKKVCFAVKNDKNNIVGVIREFMENEETQKEYKENIKEFVKTVDVNVLLKKSFQKTFGGK